MAWPHKPTRRQIRQLDYQTGYFERTPDNKANLTIPKWSLWAAVVFAILATIIWFFTKAPWLQVKHISIEGEATEDSIAAINKLYGHNILWLSVTNPEKAIKQNQPSIRQIQILRGIPDTLKVKLIERQPAVLWQVNDHWFTLDPYGFAFRDQTLTKKEDGSFDIPGTDLPVVVDTRNVAVQIGQTVVRPQFIGFVNDLKTRLPKEFNLRLIRAEIGETSFNVTAVTDAGWNVLFDTTRSLDAQLHTLTKVLESKRNDVHEYVDVRVRGWVYYK